MCPIFSKVKGVKRDRKSIGQLVKEFRKAGGLTQMRLSEMIGVSYQQIQKYEKSIDNISVERLKQIAEAVGVPVTAFFPSDRDREMVAETPAAYGKLSEGEHLLVQLFRRIKDKKLRIAVLELLKTMARK